jgi:glycosyltransferase involved in cell wall biosynthesis
VTEPGDPSGALRVLHVTPGYPTPEQPHSHVYVATQVESLRALGVHCEVLPLRGGPVGKFAAGYRQVRAPLARRRREGAGFDVLHAHHSWAGASCLGNGIPVVVSFLGSDLLAFPWRNDDHGALSRRVNGAVARWTAKRADAVIVKAAWMREALGNVTAPVHVIPNGVDLERFHPAADDAERAELRAHFGWPADTRIVIFGADPARPRKRFRLAQAAVEAAAQRLAQESPAPRLRLVPLHDRPHDEVARALRAADVLLFTSDTEGSPNIVKEAMASNLAIVSVDVGDTRERLDGVGGCRVVEDAPEALEAALTEMVARKERSMARSVIEDLALERIAEQVLAVYRRAHESQAESL